MHINLLSGVAEHPREADKSAPTAGRIIWLICIIFRCQLKSGRSSYALMIFRDTPLRW
jgi:hypothetical protein